MNGTYLAHEYENCEPTGRRLGYLAETIEQAVASVLYTERLKNGLARIGPTGRVVHIGNRCLAVVKERRGGLSRLA